MKNLIKHEIQQFLYGLRFPIALAIVLIMFVASSLTYIGEYKEVARKYHEQTANQETLLREQASNATDVATNDRSYQLSPRGSGFISDCGELNMPNTLVYNAYYHIEFDTEASKNNPFIMPSSRINWAFVILVLFSFLAIIFSFDAISGEKEQRTLTLCLSNPVRRSHILASKFIAINTLLITFAVTGMLLALVILMLAPTVQITVETFLEIGLFFLFGVFFIGSMTAIGMFSSVISRSSSISLLLSVSLWLIFMIAAPSFAQTVGMNFYPVEKYVVMWTNINEKRKEIEAGFPDGKWTSSGNKPFLPQHEIRAAMQTAFAKSVADFEVKRRNEQFRQLEKTRQWTWISPLAVFEYGTEALLDGGYLRLRKNYNDLQNFKIQYMQWFKDLDAKDDQSPHWYNAYEDYSTTKKAVTFEEIPQFTERLTTIGERLAETLKYLSVMLAYMCLMFLITVIRFEKYDVK
jgi:ABC-type transport system involved in multi-copper enzyme maturation permease subunit